MRIHLVGSLNPAVTVPSGVRSYVLALASGLSRLGQDVRVLGVGPQVAETEEFEFVPITEHAVSSAQFVLALARYLRRAEKLEGIVHGGRPDDLVPFHIEAGHLATVLTLHGAHSVHVRAKRGALFAAAYRLAERYSLDRARAILCVSPGTHAYFSKKYPRVASRLRIIPAGVDMTLFRVRSKEEARHRVGLDPSAKYLAFVGRFEPEKDPIRILTEFVKLRTRHPDAKLLLIGNGRLENELKTMAVAHQDCVAILRTMPQDQLAAILAASDALVVASRDEGLPTVAFEALACGTPIVGTRVGILPEVIRPGTNGYLVDSPTELHPFMEKALYGTSWVEEVCRASVREFGWDRIAPEILEVYREIAT